MKTKNLISFLVLLGIVGFFSQIALAQIGTANVYPQCDKTRLSPIKCGFYEEGFQDGIDDARNNRDSDHRRYRNKFDNQYESFYRNGYEEGFRTIKPNSNWTNQQKDAYDEGYDFGSDDRRRNVSRLPARYEGRYDRAYETFYQQGYYDGYDNKSKQYNSPIGTTPTVPTNPFPNRGNNRRGTPTGTLNWSGKVDNRVHIVLQGDDVQTKQIAGIVSGVSQNLQGVLPRRNATVSVIKLDGRGTARVVQQPNRSNNYTAIVEVSDPQRSDDNYNLQISWRSNQTEEPYSSGKLTWRGRVDQTVNIRISGDFVEAIDETNSGLTVIRSDLQGYLAGRNGNVRVDRKKGRGTVTVLEQPSAQNDYTAVVQIFDPRGGDDEYELEITW